MRISGIVMKELTEIDSKIIKALLEDGRKSFSTIAQEGHTSKDIIWKHYKELKKAGIIQGATTQVNCRKLGYSGVATISIGLETQNLAKAFERLKSMSDMGIFRYYNTSNNLAVITRIKNLNDLEKVKEMISKENDVNEITTNLWLDVRNMPENIIKDADPTEKPNKPLAAEEKNVKIDKIDLQIIDILSENGRMPFSKIANEMELSTNTIVRRYERLVKNSFLRVVIQVNPILLGYQAILDLNLSLSNQTETNEIANKLSKIPGVSYIVKLGGNYDLLVVALVKDCNDIITINDQIVKIPHIKKVYSTMRQIPPVWPTPHQYITTF